MDQSQDHPGDIKRPPDPNEEDKEELLKEFSSEQVDEYGVGTQTKLLHHRDNKCKEKMNRPSILSTVSGRPRSVGVSVKMNNGTIRTRIDNLGGYHEYPYRETQDFAPVRPISLNDHGPTTMSKASKDRKILDTMLQNSDAQSHVIMNEIRGFISADSPVTITALMSATKVFIHKCRDHKNLLPPAVTKMKGFRVYEVVNHERKRIFLLKQTGSTRIWEFLLLYGFIRQKFEFTVVDKTGKAALVVQGKQYLFGVYITSIIKYVDEGFLGLMKQSFCDGSYKIEDENGRIMFTLVGPVFSCYASCIFWCFEEEFEICLSGSADEVGRVGKFWKTDEFLSDHNHIGASFPSDMSVRSKAILLGALLTIKWQYFVDGGNGVIMIMLYLILLGGGLFIYFFIV